MIDRRAFLGTLAGGLLAAPLAAEGQQPGHAYQIGYVSAASATGARRYLEAFRQGLRELGWVENQNIVIESRFAEGRLDELPALAAELVRRKVDVLVASPTPAAMAAKNATTSIPIVLPNVSDPVALGFVANVARPGGNITGFSHSVGLETVGKGLEFLKDAVPRVRRLAVLSNPGNPAHTLAVNNVKAVARSLGLQLEVLEVRDPADFEGAFAKMAQGRVGALLVVADATLFVHRERLAHLEAQARLPAMHGLREEVEAGSLMSYGPNLVAQYRRAATYVDKILKGAKPADLPVQQPTEFELVINMKTAKALGLTIPPSLLQRADQVIE